MPLNNFVTARNIATASVSASLPPFVAIAPAALADMQCLTAGMTMTAGPFLTAGSFYEVAYRRACALVAARRSAERLAGKIIFATAPNCA